MKWDRRLLDDQKDAASHIGCHARLLAGPGTGKTLTLARRVGFLVSEKGISPKQILALTFTRAAAFELRNRIADVLGRQEKLPRVSTLHSFALRQLLRNSSHIESIPRPIRIADDWEERQIILEDLKDILDCGVNIVRDKFNLLSADWQTLVADEKEWEKRFSEPKFLGAWQEHRDIFGYTLRSELVYQLKRSLEQIERFSLESNYSHLLVDEYQDLNRCDLAVIFAIRDRGVEIFASGDDDQSIYGFRYAHPEGIRRFQKDYVPSSLLDLGTCVRCDRNIIKLSLFVANLDPRRLEKPLEPRDKAGKGAVNLLRFSNERVEAKGVATICRYLLDREGYTPGDILVLMRSDRYGAFSSVLQEAFNAQDVPVAVRVGEMPLNTEDGRIYLATLHLLAHDSDSLALRTLLVLRENRIGKKSYSKLYDLARSNGETFSHAARRVITKPSLIPELGIRIRGELREIQSILDKHRDQFESLGCSSKSDSLLDCLRGLAEDVIENTDSRTEVLRFLELVVAEMDASEHKQLLLALSSSLEDKEQELDPGRVNIMTMHKAKGLTSKAVIVIAAEDEYIPGRQAGESEGDERRLLYVSLSRAQHFLAVTYCESRIGRQRHTGRTSGRTDRTLTKFLRDAPIIPTNGASFVEELKAKLGGERKR